MSILSAEVTKSDLPIIKDFLDKKEYKTANQLLAAYLVEHPKDDGALFLYGRLMNECENPAIAVMCYQHNVDNGYATWQNWLNLGHSYDQLSEAKKAEKCYLKALELEPNNEMALTSLGTCYVQQYRSQEAVKVLEKVIASNPEAGKARSSLGFAYLQLREFGKGWDHYEAGYGKLQWRTERKYIDEGLWNGAKKKSQHVIVHGEQGLGDQIAGAEIINDMAEDVSIQAVEVTPKLANLFKRSFPDLDIRDTLGEHGIDWPHAKTIDSHCGFFTGHKWYRRKSSDYSGKPYLRADTDRRLMWRALFDSWGKRPTVGIAWSGGVAVTHRGARRADLNAWLPILGMDCDFVSLEYKNRKEDIAALQRRRKIKIHEFPFATQSDDYDDTAALVAELDFVVCVPTSIVHLAGALGVPTMCMVHDTPNIHYGCTGDDMPYYGSVELFRRKNNEWPKAVSAVVKTLKDRIDAPRLHRAG
tara:strand:+ start:10985 stop:12403 length:1419 start_codon:yes stop_codon:yes gene_type:complete